MSSSTRKKVKVEAVPAHHCEPSLFSAEEPAAVRPHDLDTVFLSKTVVSLDHVFAHTVDGHYDVSPLQAWPSRNAGQQRSEQEMDQEQTQMNGVSAPFSSGSAPYTSFSLKCVASDASTHSPALRPKEVLRDTDGRWRSAPTSSSAAAGASTTASSTESPPTEAQGHMICVPLDTYHFLLTYRGVDFAGQRGRSHDHHTAMTAVERLSAASSGCRPPRSGICVVRRLEGEQRGVKGASSSMPSSTTAAPASTAYPTLSHVVHGLPLDAFDGWVRDYTVYGLSCNEAVLRAAWEDKTRERAEDAVATRSAFSVGLKDSMTSLPQAGSTPTLCETSDDTDLAAPREHSSEDVDKATTANRMPMPTTQVNEMTERSAEEAVTRTSDNVGKAATISPSLERLDCSSTTTSSDITPTPSVSIERNGEGNDLGVAEVTTEVIGRKHGGVPATFPVSRASTPTQQQQHKNVLWDEERARTEWAAAQLRHRFLVSDSKQHAIWALEVCLPTMEVRAVSPAEFYTVEMEEDKEEQPTRRRHNAHGTDTRSTMRCTDEMRDECFVEHVRNRVLPRRRPAVTAAQGRVSSSSHRGSLLGAPPAHASRLRSPSPTNPSTRSSAAKDADGRPCSPPAGDDERRCSTSVTTRSDAASCSTQRCGRTTPSASPSLAMAEAVPTPLMGGARGFVDGHFSVARFCSPGALCWRIDDDDDDRKDATVASENSDSSGDGVDFHHGMVTESEPSRGRRPPAAIKNCREDPIAYLRRRRRCTVLFISDTGNCSIRYADFHNQLVRTIAGVNGVPGYRDGSCTSSMMRKATALAWCSAGLIFADGANNVVRLITDIRKPRKRSTQRSSFGETEEAAIGTSARSPARAPASEKENLPLLEVPEVSTAPEQPHGDEAKKVDEARHKCPVVPKEFQGGSRKGQLPSSTWQRESTAVVIPRVWTLAGCTNKSSSDHPTQMNASVASYVDSVVSTRARFGYISDMTLWTDETGDTQLLLVDQTHHALRIVDAHGGVSTYVGPLDYHVTSMLSPSTTSTTEADSLPSGLIFPCSLTVGALIKERSPALLSARATTAATMITPQPYLCSSSPLLFIASAVTGTVSVLLPISKRSAPTPCSPHAIQDRSVSTEAREAEAIHHNSVDDVAKLEAIRGALELGVATEGRRIIGEASTPSLKHVVVCWGEDDDDRTKMAHTARHRLSEESRQQALHYLRLRFPWLLPPSVPMLSSRLVAGCTCHVSGKRRGTTAPIRDDKAVRLHSRSGSSNRVVTPAEGVEVKGANGLQRSATRTASTATARPVQHQRLLFEQPARHSATTTGRGKFISISGAPPCAVMSSLQSHSHDVGGDGAAAVDQGGCLEDQRSSSSYGEPAPLSSNDNTEKGKSKSTQSSRDAVQIGKEKEGRRQMDRDDVSGGRAVAKWLAPPLKSVSRSPSGTRELQQQQQQPPPAGLCSSPSKGTATTYAGQFQEWPPEQRQKCLRSTVEDSVCRLFSNTSPRGTPRALEEQRQSMETGRNSEGRSSPLEARSAVCGSPEQPHSLLSLSSPMSSPSPRRHHHSPNNVSTRSSPPLTPRAMVAHQLMQPRRSSRSSTAPHVRSVDCDARIPTGGRRVAVMDGSDDSPPPPQTRRNGSIKTPTAPAELPSSSIGLDRRTTQLCGADPSLHDEYDAAVHRLFRVYSYLATRVVTTATAAPSASMRGKERGRDSDLRVTAASKPPASDRPPWDTHQPHQVVQYTMSFAAFLRFFVLTGYGDYLADVAAAAVATVKTTSAVDQHGQNDGVDTRTARSPVSMMCRLTRLQKGRSCSGITSAPQRSSTFGAPLTAHTKPPPPSDVMVVPLATTDARSIAAVLYACGVRRKGYHTVAQMNFQSFRRAALLLYTWARTAHDAETAKQAPATNDGGDEQSKACCSMGGQNGSDTNNRRRSMKGQTAATAAFAYVDVVPSLDALSSEEVVAAYTEVYERTVRCIPALAMSYGQELTTRGGEDDGDDNHGGATTETGKLQKPSDAIPSGGEGNTVHAAGSAASQGIALKHLHGIGRDEHCTQHDGVNGTRVGPDEAATPPLSPIAATGAADDVSCFAIDGNDAPKSRKNITIETMSALQKDNDATNAFLPHQLAPREIIALDELLRLLQRNEPTLRHLFEAYSVPITVHRSPQYEAPLSAAVAASASNSCSVLVYSPEASPVLGDCRGALARLPRHASPTCVAATSGTTPSALGDYPVVAHRNHRTGGTSTAVGINLERGSGELSSVSTTQQDVSWKVQQLYTLSAAENKEVYERKSQVLQVMPFALFAELWRTLDVFPSLMSKAAMEQAFHDALTTPMLRGLKSPTPACASGTPLPQTQEKPRPPLARPADLANRRVVELSCAHGGLPYACFAESFFRVALTVFSHEVDRVAYPTATAKTVGLMQWCNKQVTLGLVAKRAQQQHTVVLTSRHRSNKKALMPSADAAENFLTAAPTARTVRPASTFPMHLRLFRVSSTPK